MEKKTKERPISKAKSEVGKTRQQLYAHVMAQYKKAMDEHFYIEAVALMDSIVCDRLESLAANLTENEPKFVNKNLDFLLREIPTDLIPEKIKPTLEELKEWKDNRNIAIHEIAKLQSDALDKDFQAKYKENKAIAETGKKLFRKLDNEIRKYRRNKQ